MKNYYNFYVGQPVSWTKRISPFMPDRGNGTIAIITNSKRFPGEVLLTFTLEGSQVTATISSMDPEFEFFAGH